MEQTEIAREQGAPAASILAEQAWEGKVRKVFHGLCRCICVWCLGHFRYISIIIIMIFWYRNISFTGSARLRCWRHA